MLYFVVATMFMVN